MPVMPISRLVYELLEPYGGADALLVAAKPGVAAAAALAARRCRGDDGAPLDIAALPVGDLDAIVAELRGAALGDRLTAEAACPACDARVDVDLSLAELRAHHRPRPYRGVAAADDGWYRLRDGATTFRAPTVADVMSVSAASTGRRELVARCVRGDSSTGKLRVVERALEQLAPTLHTDIAGSCPECGAEVVLGCDTRELCLEELKSIACDVIEDVHLIASAYHWSEASILALPSAHRRRYAALIRADRASLIASEALDV